MSDINIHKLWLDFITKYQVYFLSNEELWNNNLLLVEQYIIIN